MTTNSTRGTSTRGPADWRLRLGVPAALLVVAALCWWWSIRMAIDMSRMDASMPGMTMGEMLSLGGFVVAWLVMMAAMMLPAIWPVLRLYALAATHGRVAPLPFFAAAYLVVWTVPALPAYAAWRYLETPIAQGAPWAGRLAGGVLVVAAIWQLTPLKTLCLRHCRSPLSFFMQYGGGAARPWGAFRMGAAHGLFCLGCCWALMAVMVALGTMNLAVMIALGALIFAEKNLPGGERIAVGGAAIFALAGVALLFDPGLLTALNH